MNTYDTLLQYIMFCTRYDMRYILYDIDSYAYERMISKKIFLCCRNILVLKELGKPSLVKKENKNEYWVQIMP